MIKHVKVTFVSSAVVAALLGLVMVAQAGDLDPPAGPIEPTMKTLTEVEPRTAVSSLPLLATASGSYYLTQNVAGDINIDDSGVTLDLNGFTLMGMVTVTGANVTIRNGVITEGGINSEVADNVLIEYVSVIGTEEARPGRGPGISVGPGGRCFFSTAWNDPGVGIAGWWGATIKWCAVINGASHGIMVLPGSSVSDSISVFNDGDGVHASYDCLVDGVIAFWNGNGIVTGPRATISNCNASDNTTDGIVVDHGSTICCSTAGKNQQGNGFTLGAGSTIKGCTAEENGGSGITAGEKCSVIDCTTASNGADGIHTADDCLIDASTAVSNALGIATGARTTVSTCTVDSNDGDGINVGHGSTVTGCTAGNNSDGNGITAAKGSTIRGCTTEANGLLGISTQERCSVVACTAAENGWVMPADGISVGFGSSVLESNSSGNTQHGILAGQGSTITDCTAERNTVDGINVAVASTISNCTVYYNGNYGICATGANASISACTATYNNADQIYLMGASTVSNCAVACPYAPGITALGAEIMVTDCSVYSARTTGIHVGPHSTVRNCKVLLVMYQGMPNSGGIVVDGSSYIVGNNVGEHWASTATDGIVVNGDGNRVEKNHVYGGYHPQDGIVVNGQNS